MADSKLTTAAEMLEAVLAAIEAEEELDGPIPPQVKRETLVDPERSLRAAVITTKLGIAKRIAAFRSRIAPPPEPDSYTLPYVEGPIQPEPAQQHAELRHDLWKLRRDLWAYAKSRLEPDDPMRRTLLDAAEALSAAPPPAPRHKELRERIEAHFATRTESLHACALEDAASALLRDCARALEEAE